MLLSDVYVVRANSARTKDRPMSIVVYARVLFLRRGSDEIRLINSNV